MDEPSRAGRSEPLCGWHQSSRLPDLRKACVFLLAAAAAATLTLFTSHIDEVMLNRYPITGVRMLLSPIVVQQAIALVDGDDVSMPHDGPHVDAAIEVVYYSPEEGLLHDSAVAAATASASVVDINQRNLVLPPDIDSKSQGLLAAESDYATIASRSGVVPAPEGWRLVEHENRQPPAIAKTAAIGRPKIAVGSRGDDAKSISDAQLPAPSDVQGLMRVTAAAAVAAQLPIWQHGQVATQEARAITVSPSLVSHSGADTDGWNFVPPFAGHSKSSMASADRGTSTLGYEIAAAGCVGVAIPHDAKACVEELQRIRQEHLTKVCQQYSELSYRHRMWHLKMDRRRGLTYCPIPKAGWSSWKRLLFYINGAINSTDVEIGITPDDTVGVIDVSQFTVQRMRANGLQPYVFVFVRNPWDRLVSAYINKVLDWNYTRIMHSPCLWESMEPYREPITFSQFLSCIVESSDSLLRTDIHWTPMWQLCDFCQMRYEHVGHMETVAEDAAYILEKNNISAVFPHAFPSRAHRVRDVIEDWYKDVPADVISRLQRLYKYDFLLHGYSDVPPGRQGKPL